MEVKKVTTERRTRPTSSEDKSEFESKLASSCDEAALKYR
jgi:hypothetical protein